MLSESFQPPSAALFLSHSMSSAKHQVPCAAADLFVTAALLLASLSVKIGAAVLGFVLPRVFE